MKILSKALVFSLVVLCAVAVYGQGVTRATISGVVTDADNARLPGATVEAVHQPTGTRYTVTTDENGQFAIHNVRTGGPYTVSVSLDGFHPLQSDATWTKLGEETKLSFQLQLATVTETVTVVGESNPLISPSRTGNASNVGVEGIENMPSIAREFSDFTRLNPFITQTQENDDPISISVLGRSSRYNNIQIDGAVNNDLFGLADTGTPGGQTGTTPISLDAIEELQAVVAPYDVRQGGFTGGGINAVTRSGSNAYHGSVFYFMRDEDLVGDGPPELGEVGTFDSEQLGFRVGGPIARNRIFFFVNGEISDQNQPTGWSLDGSGGQCFANCEVIDQANRFRDILVNRYNYNPGGLGQFTRSTPSDKAFLRFDFNIADRHQLTLRYNYVDASSDINRPSPFTYEWPGEAYQITDETNSIVGQLNSAFGSVKFNELRLTFQTIEDRRGPANGVQFPWIEIEDVDGNRREFEAGTEAFSTRNALDQDIFELTDDFTWIMGNHTLTIGTHNEFFTFDNLFIQNAFGAYEFTDMDAFDAGIARRYRLTVVNPGQAPTQKFDVYQIGLYAGDQWATRPNLTLTYGLRVDIPYFPDSPSRNPFTEETYGVRTDNMPNGEQLWQPRLGFNWDLKSDGQQQLRGGIGVFAGRTPYVWMSNQYARTGVEQTFLTATGEIPFDPDPFGQPPEGIEGKPAIGEFNLIDPNFKFPQVLRFNLAYDRQLPWWGMVGTVELILSDSLEEIDYQDLNRVQTGQLTFDGRPLYTKLDPLVDGAYFITNSSEGDTTNFLVKVERPFRDGIWGYASYAFGEANNVNDGTSSRAVSNYRFNPTFDPNSASLATSNFEVEHRFNIGIAYRFNRNSRWPTTVTSYYNAQSGRPYSSLLDSFSFDSYNGDGWDSNDLFYVPAGPDDVIITNGTWEQLDAYIKSDPCLDSSRGQRTLKNCDTAPWVHQMDLRVAQDIPIRNTNLQLTLDILNFANMLDDESGVVRFVNFNTIDLADFVGLDEATGKPIYSLRREVTDPENNPRYEISTVGSRWRARLGIRWTF